MTYSMPEWIAAVVLFAVSVAIILLIATVTGPDWYRELRTWFPATPWVQAPGLRSSRQSLGRAVKIGDRRKS